LGRECCILRPPDQGLVARMDDRFIYDEKTSRLFAPDGQFLKRVDCPKAVHWNQLIADDPDDRSRGCRQCGNRVLNLDVLDTRDVLAAFEDGHTPCVFASAESRRVLVLRARRPMPPPDSVSLDKDGRTVIRTARSLAGINRAARMGYWPDVRLVEYDAARLKSKFAIGQHEVTGEVELLGDYRGGFAHGVQQINPFEYYYPYYRPMPIAAYLLPKHLEDGAPLLVLDPIQDVIGSRWNQGSVFRATRVPGVLRNRRVELRLDEVVEFQMVG
jgi:hypothetical protein